MPARNRSNNLPAAPKRKRMLHAVYLVQPFLQFFALMAVLFVLGRCSPLSPSKEIARMKSFSDNGVIATPAENGDSIAIEEHYKEISAHESMPIFSQASFREYVRESLFAHTRADQGRVKYIFQQRNREIRRSTRVMSISLTPDERVRLVQGSLRIDLSKRLASQMDADTMKLFFSLLRSPQKNLHGKAILVHSDQDAELSEAVSEIPLGTMIRVAILPGDEKAYLQVSRIEQRISAAQQELITANLARAIDLAVVLE